jgi:hypothetical protein
MGDEMNWFRKNKTPTGPLVWMIQKKGSNPPLFLGACKAEIVFLSNWKACFRFNDIDSASLMIYWLLQSGKIKLGDFEAVPAQLGIENKIK